MGKSLNGKELGRGISQRKDGLYQGTYIDVFGKRRYLYGKTIKEITEKLYTYKHEDNIDSSYTVDEWFNVWLSTYKINLRNTTIADIKYIYKDIQNILGDIKLDKINPIVLQKTINSFNSYNKRNRCYLIINDMLNCATKTHIIKENPTKDIVVLKDMSEEKDKRVLSDKEVDLLLKYSKGKYLYYYIQIALNTGMRCGEITGLTWDNIDFINYLVHVRHTYINKGSLDGRIKELHKPKTKKGYRDIPMTEELKNILLEIQNNYSCRVKDNEYKNFVLLTKIGTGNNQANINLSLKRLVNKINIKENLDDSNKIEYFTSHALRRTFATRAIRNGMNPKTLQYILGHSSYEMTMDLYCQVLQDDVKKQMKFIGKICD